MELRELFTQLLDAGLQRRHLCIHHLRLGSVRFIELLQIVGNRAFDAFDTTCHLRLREVLIPVVHRFELAPVNGHRHLRDQRQPMTHSDELPADRHNGFAIVLAKRRYRLVIRRQATG